MKSQVESRSRWCQESSHQENEKDILFKKTSLVNVKRRVNGTVAYIYINICARVVVVVRGFYKLLRVFGSDELPQHV